MHVITTVEPQAVPATDVADARLVWIGLDDAASSWKSWRWISTALS